MNPPATARFVLAAGVILAAPFVRAAEDALRPIAYQNGVNQDALGAETAELARAINALIDELQRNGFPAQSLSGLNELVAQLGALGGADMSALAARLRGLGENTATDSRGTVSEVYIAQQGIETRLKALAQQIALRQLREEAVHRLEALIARQLAAQRETQAIASVRSPGSRQSLLESDQSGVGEDLDAFFQTGETLLSRLQARLTGAAPTPAAPAASEPAPSFAERVNATALSGFSSEALQQIKGRHYPEAAARQEALLVELKKLLQGMLSSLPKDQRLASALQQVAALRQQETARQENGKKPDAEADQAAADRAQLLAAQIAPVNPEAAADLTNAQKALQSPTAKGTPATPPDATKMPVAKSPSTPSSTTPPTPATASTPPSTPPASASASAAKPPGTPGATPPGSPPPVSSDPSKSPPTRADALAALARAEAALRQQLAAEQSGQNSGQTDPAAPQTSQQANMPGNRPPRDSSTGGGQTTVANHGDQTADPAQVVGALRHDEREAMLTLQQERYPAEYSAWVRQYWRNLAKEP